MFKLIDHIGDFFAAIAASPLKALLFGWVMGMGTGWLARRVWRRGNGQE